MTLKMKIAWIVTHRFSIIAISAFFLVISIYNIEEALLLLLDETKNVEGIDTLLNALGAIFIAYGVALEGRPILMKFFGLYPKYHTEKEETADRICEDYGLLLLIGGLLMEVAAEVVVIPSHIFKLKHQEAGAFTAGFLSWLVVVYLLVRKSMHLISCRSDYGAGPNNEA
jgi:hypothetical protein